MEEKYLSDKELEELIAGVEASGMHQAPFYLRSEIMEKIERQEKKKKAFVRRELLFYSLKIGIAAAAALMFLTFIPAEDWKNRLEKQPVSIAEEEEREQWTEVVNQKAKELCNWLSETAESMRFR